MISASVVEATLPYWLRRAIYWAGGSRGDGLYCNTQQGSASLSYSR